MGEIKYNGRTYSGLIQANGCFVDTTNLLLATTSFRTSYSYTATEDCFVCLYVVPKENDDVHVDIDGEKVAAWWRGSAIADETARYLRKGQTISVVNAHASYDSFIWVYGLMQGSPITFLSEYASACYDTNEREVGCWVDGKPIYQRTVHIGNLTFDSSWHNVAHGITDIDKVISCIGIMFGEDGEFFSLPIYRSATQQGITWGIQGSSSEYLAYINNWYNSTNDSYATILYTKTTDTAGSGKLTPTGFETHHYSTNEQIVGTWIDGKPLYEVTVEADNPTINSYSDNKYIEATYSSSVIDFAKCVSCAVYDSTDSRWYTLPYERMISTENINLQAMRLANGSYIVTAHWKSTNSYNTTKFRYTIQFTKTTD